MRGDKIYHINSGNLPQPLNVSHQDHPPGDSPRTKEDHPVLTVRGGTSKETL